MHWPPDETPPGMLAALDRQAAALVDHYRTEHDLDLHDPQVRRVCRQFMACPSEAVSGLIDGTADDDECKELIAITIVTFLALIAHVLDPESDPKGT